MNIIQHTILLIDDSKDDILLTKMALAKISKKIKVETALSGEAGLLFLQNGKSRPSLILLDLKMPGMDGIEVLRRIRQEESLSDTPVVITTHSNLESDKVVSLEAGANSFLRKASNLDLFKKDLERILNRCLSASTPPL